IRKGKTHQQMEWWETTDEYNPGISIWRGKPILNEESDLEILVKEEMDFKEEKEESDLEILIKDEMAETVPQGKCKAENTIDSDQSVVVISSDDEMEVDSSPLKQSIRKKRQRISSVSHKVTKSQINVPMLLLRVSFHDDPVPA
ncbi:hypothetical protein OS493_039795, partial [Desmophyllum pertusum]